MKGSLFLLPNLLAEGLPWDDFFPKKVAEIVASLQGLIVESEKGGWRFLRHFFSQEKIASFPIRLLNEHTREELLEELIAPLLKGERWGLISDAGLPCIADPGAQLVFAARKRGVFIEAFPGPSSIVHALMLSGFSGQSFCFHGYLPIEKESFRAKLLSFEKNMSTTHLWMETPYRVQSRLQEMVGFLQEKTLLCLSCDLALASQEVIVATIREWKKRDLSSFHKRLAIFLMGQVPKSLETKK